jgi:mono/diheme cytochrome c family protein
MTRAARIGLVVVLLLALVLGGGGMYLLRHGYSARDQPSAMEAAVARRLRRMATPAGAGARANPVPPTPEVLAEARAHWADHCAICHANDGSGDTPIGQGLYPKAPDMRKAATQQLSDGELFYVIRNGVRFTGMPAWGGTTEQDDRDSWALVHFVRHIPRLTPGELAQMRKMNPKSARELEEEREAEEFLRGGETAPEPSPGAHNH